MVGTKTGFISLLGTLLTALIIFSLNLFKKTRKEKIHGNNLVLLLMSLFLIFGFINQLPVSTKIGLHINSIDQDIEKNEVPSENTNTGNTNDETTVKQLLSAIPKEWIANYDKGMKLIFSNRLLYLSNSLIDWQNAHILQKTFGSGYAGNYVTKAKLVEMDFHDFYFTFGPILFMLFFIPFMLLIFYLVSAYLRNFTILGNTINTLLLLSLLTVIAASFFSGHVLFSPSVSFYLALLLALIQVIFRLQLQKGKDFTI
jgi:hypothetical protein